MTRRTGLRWAVLAIAAAAIVAGVFLWRHFRQARASQSVPTAKVRQGDFTEIVRCRGEIGAGRSVQVTAPMNVPDLKILWMVTPGSRVKTGETVLRFDPTGAKRQLEEASAALRQAQATLQQAAAQARTTGEQDRLDLANARYDVERAKLEASKRKIVSVLQGEASKIDLASAESKLRVQQATIELHRKSDESKTASLKRQLEKAQSDVDLIKKRIDQMELKSPIDGIVSYMMNRSQGWMNQQPFKVGDAVWSGAIVAEIPDPATLQMEGKLEEVERGRVTIGAEVRIHADAFPEKTFPGKLETISPLTEMSWEWPPVRSFIAYAPIHDPDPRLRKGMNGSLDIVIRHIPDALSVVAKAIFTRNGKPIVYVAAAGGYRPVEIEVVASNPDEIAIRGVLPGDSVCLAEPGQDKEKRR